MSTNSTTEAAILKAAEDEFINKGYNGARTVSIAQAAGVTHAMLHYYFRTKEQLFERVLNNKFNLMADSIIESLDSDDDTVDIQHRIKSFIYRHYTFVADNSRLPLFVINEVVNAPERIGALKSKLVEKLGIIAEKIGKPYNQAVRDGAIADVDLLTLIIDIVALNLFSVIMRPVAQSITQRGDQEYDRWRIEENITLIMKRIAL